jgi:hypothetical protein
MANELSNEDLRNEILARMEAMETRREKMETDILTVVANLEANLAATLKTELRVEFRKLSQPLVSRLRTNEVGLIGSNERLDAIEYRVSNLELERGPS